MQLIELRSGREGRPLPRRGLRAAPPDRRGPPRRRGRDDARRHGRRAAPGAHPQRDAHGAAARGRGRRLTARRRGVGRPLAPRCPLLGAARGMPVLTPTRWTSQPARRTVRTVDDRPTSRMSWTVADHRPTRPLAPAPKRRVLSGFLVVLVVFLIHVGVAGASAPSSARSLPGRRQSSSAAASRVGGRRARARSGWSPSPDSQTRGDRPSASRVAWCFGPAGRAARWSCVSWATAGATSAARPRTWSSGWTDGRAGAVEERAARESCPACGVIDRCEVPAASPPRLDSSRLLALVPAEETPRPPSATPVPAIPCSPTGRQTRPPWMPSDASRRPVPRCCTRDHRVRRVATSPERSSIVRMRADPRRLRHVRDLQRSRSGRLRPAGLRRHPRPRFTVVGSSCRGPPSRAARTGSTDLDLLDIAVERARAAACTSCSTSCTSTRRTARRVGPAPTTTSRRSRTTPEHGFRPLRALPRRTRGR